MPTHTLTFGGSESPPLPSSTKLNSLNSLNSTSGGGSAGSDSPSACRTSSKPSNEPLTTPYTILIDTREQHPLSFDGFSWDSDQNYRPVAALTERECLGNHFGDYSIRGFEPRKLDLDGYDPFDSDTFWATVSLERKSQADAYGTFLGFGERRDRFELELSNLNRMTFAAILVECSEYDLIQQAPETSNRSAKQNAKAISRSVNSWRIDYPRVQWVFCSTRRMAEEKAFRLLDSFFEKTRKKMIDQNYKTLFE